MLGKLPLTAGGFADDFEYSGHPSATPPPGGSTGWWGEISLSLFFFFSPFFFFLFIYLYRVSPRWGEALGRNKMSFFQEKIFLTKKNIFRPGANALNFTLSTRSGKKVVKIFFLPRRKCLFAFFPPKIFFYFWLVRSPNKRCHISYSPPPWPPPQ